VPVGIGLRPSTNKLHVFYAGKGVFNQAERFSDILVFLLTGCVVFFAMSIVKFWERISRLERGAVPKLAPKMTDSSSDFSNAAISSFLPGGGRLSGDSRGSVAFLVSLQKRATSGGILPAGGGGGEGFDSLLHHSLQHLQHGQSERDQRFHGGGGIRGFKQGSNGAGQGSRRDQQGFVVGGIKRRLLWVDKGRVIPTQVIGSISLNFTFSTSTLSTRTTSIAKNTRIVVQVGNRDIIPINTSHRGTKRRAVGNGHTGQRDRLSSHCTLCSDVRRVHQRAR
jgi:hypothetical protein